MPNEIQSVHLEWNKRALTGNTRNIMKEMHFVVLVALCCLASCGSPNKRSAEGGKARDTTERRDIPENKGEATSAKDSTNTPKDSVKRQHDTTRQQEITRLSCHYRFNSIILDGRYEAFNMKGVKAVAAEGVPIYRCSFSYSNSDTMPDLSEYNIVHLDLSHNNIGRSFSLARLPQTLETLDLSHNRLGESGGKELQTLSFRGEWEKRFPKLRVLNVSHNKLRAIYFPESVERIDASHNRLERFMPAWETPQKAGNLRYLDLSHNPKLKPEEFVGEVDTLITEDCPPDTI